MLFFKVMFPFFTCVSFHVSCFVLLAFLFILFVFLSLTFGQVKGNARQGRSRHPVATPTNQNVGVCKVNLATLKVAMNEEPRRPSTDS